MPAVLPVLNFNFPPDNKTECDRYYRLCYLSTSKLFVRCFPKNNRISASNTTGFNFTINVTIKFASKNTEASPPPQSQIALPDSCFNALTVSTAFSLISVTCLSGLFAANAKRHIDPMLDTDWLYPPVNQLHRFYLPSKQHQTIIGWPFHVLLCSKERPANKREYLIFSKISPNFEVRGMLIYEGVSILKNEKNVFLGDYSIKNYTYSLEYEELKLFGHYDKYLDFFKNISSYIYYI